ncbi:MAG: hypothetical protein JWQ35_2251 [Bacteriovoracaceae bacterium]|nr:hypothetical protein [Bacteriovoracaceae bacterium]
MKLLAFIVILLGVVESTSLSLLESTSAAELERIPMGSFRLTKQGSLINLGEFGPCRVIVIYDSEKK